MLVWGSLKATEGKREADGTFRGNCRHFGKASDPNFNLSLLEKGQNFKPNPKNQL